MKSAKSIAANSKQLNNEKINEKDSGEQQTINKESGEQNKEGETKI